MTVEKPSLLGLLAEEKPTEIKLILETLVKEILETVALQMDVLSVMAANESADPDRPDWWQRELIGRHHAFREAAALTRRFAVKL